MLDKTGWSWPEWEATPPYVQRVMWDFYQAKTQAEAAQAEQQRQEIQVAGRR